MKMEPIIDKKQIPEMDLYFGDELVGKIKGSAVDGKKYHAVIKVPEDTIGGYTCHNLAQGHGNTAEESVRNAFWSARSEAQNFLVELMILEKKFIDSVAGTSEEQE